MVIADFQMEDKGGRPRFFQETFLVTDTKFEVILGISFLKLSNADVLFSEGTLKWKFYTTIEALPTTKQIQLVDPKEFIIAALDADSKTFIVYMAIWEREKMAMDPDRKAQIEVWNEVQSEAQIRVQIGALLFNEAPTEVLAEYFNYSDVF